MIILGRLDGMLDLKKKCNVATEASAARKGGSKLIFAVNLCLNIT